MSSSLPTLEGRHSAAELIDEYYTQSKAIINKAKAADRLLTHTETKKIKELANAIKGLQTTVDEGATMTIFIRLAQYVDKTDHELAVRLTEFMMRYVSDMLNPLKQTA